MNLTGPYQELESKYFQKVIALYLSAFPTDERRPEKEFTELILSGKMELYIVLDNNQLVGFITYWNLDSFGFIEHFAVASGSRGKGYGSVILSLLLEKKSKPTLLEVETPETPQAVSRIRFYERSGFRIIRTSYVQPSYGTGRQPQDMYLMSNAAYTGEETENIVKELYRYVYNTTRQNR